jgi:hypothetical protein
MFQLKYPIFRGIQRIVAPLQSNLPEDGTFKLKEVGEAEVIPMMRTYIAVIIKYDIPKM